MKWRAWRYKQFHVSYLIGWASLSLLIGLGLAQIYLIEVPGLLIISLILIALSTLKRRRWWSIVMLVTAMMVIGLARGSAVQQSLSVYGGWVETTQTITGVVADDPQKNERGVWQFGISDVENRELHIPGQVYVTTPDGAELRRGDTVQISGMVREGFGSYGAAMSFASVEQVGRRYDPILELRDTFAAALRSVVGEPAASLGLGFVIGQRSALPPELDDQLRVVGLTHIVVASGYNLTILVRFSRRVLEKHSKYLATSVSAALMTMFVLVSGLSPSMTRASIVTGLSLLAWYYGRRFHPLLLVAYVAALTAMINPVFLWSDVGWYLSFLAFIGVLMVSPLLIRMIFKEREVNPLFKVVFETTAAQIMTLPLILMIFGDLPLLAVIANALVAAIIPLAMALTLIAGVFAMLVPALGGLFGMGAEIILGYVLGIVTFLSAPSWAQVSLSISPIVMVLGYAVILLVSAVVYYRTKYNFRSSSIVE